MTLKEVYEKIGSDYNAVVARMGNSDRILNKFIRKFESDQTAKQLFESYDSGDLLTAFRMAHTLKGLCSNLGLDKLQKSSSELTEALRVVKKAAEDTPDLTAEAMKELLPENTPELLKTVKTDYDMTVGAIAQLDS